MRIFACGLSTETNTFAPWPTGEAAFREGGYYPGNASHAGDTRETLIARQYRDLAHRDGHDFVEGLFATAEPSGPTVQSVYAAMASNILDDIARQGPFDVILLWLHGAMVSTECDDCEADLVTRIRSLVGETVAIGVEHDPHCHLSEALLRVASLVILFKEYPHTDYLLRAAELYARTIETAQGLIRPVPALFDCRMIGFYPTTSQPMAGFVARLREVEALPGILSASLAHGFPWGDTPETGSKMLVYADDRPDLAIATARGLGQEFYALRHALLPDFPTIAQALDLAEAQDGPTVLADTGDNAGGGAPSDSIAMLDALVSRGAGQAAFGCVWDPVVAAACADAGVGALMSIRLGGKCGAASGFSRDYQARVMAVRPAYDQAGPGSARIPMGLTIWVDIAGIDVVINTIRTQTFAPDAFTGLGIDLAGKRIVVVKSSQHFREHFASLSGSLIEVASPGAIEMAFANLSYVKRRSAPYFPAVDDPLGLDA